MPRRRFIPKRETLPDPVFNSQLVSRFINCIMKQGKKSTAEQIFYGALDLIQERTQDDPLKVFKRAVDNVKPQLEVKSRRVGGSTYQIPVEVPPDRQTALAIRWLLAAAQSRPGRSMAEKLGSELMDAARETGAAVKRREDTHRMAEANRAFAQYRW